ncbi:MAG: hypothetical protein AAB309_06500, partial [Deltaproteobacteria bacterium]
MMKPSTKIKLFLMFIAFLTSFSLKNYSEIVDTVYGDGGGDKSNKPVITPDPTVETEEEVKKKIYDEVFRFFEAKKKLDSALSGYREQRDRTTGLKRYEFIIDEMPQLVEKIEGLSNEYSYLPENIKKSLSHDSSELERQDSEELFNIVKAMDSQITDLQKKINES